MTCRENQGLHVSLIVFVMTAVLLAVVCYFTYSSASENADRIADTEVQLSTERILREAYQIKASILESYIGFGTMTPLIRQ